LRAASFFAVAPLVELLPGFFASFFAVAFVVFVVGPFVVFVEVPFLVFAAVALTVG
jgi:hypothetical protein